MARRKTLPDSVRTKHSLSERLRELRSEQFGERGGPELARRLGLPVRTWYNYEAGVTIPAEVVLRIIEMTAVEPMWLLHGRGPKFRPRVSEEFRAETGPVRSAGALLRSALRLLENEERVKRVNHLPSHEFHDLPRGEAHDEIVMLEVDAASRRSLASLGGPRYLAAPGEWLELQNESQCLRNVGEAMCPVVADGAYVVYGRPAEDLADLDGKLVVAWLDDDPLIRWFQLCGRYALLRAENPAAEVEQHLIDLESRPAERRICRVLWISTPHGHDRPSQ
jgi:hypothetical protein